MKILLITFTGTGNTAICGENIKQAFEEHNHIVDHFVYNTKTQFNYEINDYDLIGFGYPIHAFNVPEVFVKFIKTLSKPSSNKKYFIYKVSGEPFHFNDASSHKIVAKLKRKNYVKIAEKHFLMPYNIMFRYKDEIAKQMYLYLKPLTKIFVEDILSNNPETIKYHIGHEILSVIFRIEWVAPKINCLFLHSKKKKCINCDQCIKNCPTQALYKNKNGTIKAKASCALCMRCAYNCPNDAMNMGILNAWVVNKPFDYQKIVNDSSINSNYINHQTKGYFKKFNKYFDCQKQIIKEHGYDLPC